MIKSKVCWNYIRYTYRGLCFFLVVIGNKFIPFKVKVSFVKTEVIYRFKAEVFVSNNPFRRVLKWKLYLFEVGS